MGVVMSEVVTAFSVKHGDIAREKPVTYGEGELWVSTLWLCCCSVLKSCPTLCDPVDCSAAGFPVLHHRPEFAQTHVRWVDADIQPSHPLSPPSLPAPSLSQHQGFFSRDSALRIRWPKDIKEERKKSKGIRKCLTVNESENSSWLQPLLRESGCYSETETAFHKVYGFG